MDFLSNYDDEEEEEITKKEEFAVPFGLPTKFGGQLTTGAKPQHDQFEEIEEIEEEDEQLDDKETFDDESDVNHDDESSSPAEGKIAGDTDSFAVKHKIPVSHQVSIKYIMILCIILSISDHKLD